MNGLALCAGAGGLELAMRLVFGNQYRCVGYVERDAYAAAALVARMEEAALDPAPVWDDLSTFDGRPWRGRVDCVTAGFPCQPVSDAGKRQGTEDERWLWPHIVPIIEAAAPTLAFFENVPPLVALGLDEVVGDLARLGFHTEWAGLSTADLGGSQLRKRLWILAYRDGIRFDRIGREPSDDREPWDDARRSSRAVLACADSRRGRLGPGDAHDERQAVEPADRGVGLADTDSPGRQGSVHRPPQRWEGPARPGGSVPFWPPRPDDLNQWASVLDVAPELEPSLHGMADGMANRVDRCRTIGNGVVPLVAAKAFVRLAQRAGLVTA